MTRSLYSCTPILCGYHLLEHRIVLYRSIFYEFVSSKLIGFIVLPSCRNYECNCNANNWLTLLNHSLIWGGLV